MTMTVAESDAYWQNRILDQLTRELKSPAFLQSLKRAESLGLLLELLEGAGIPLLKLQCEIAQTLLARHLGRPLEEASSLPQNGGRPQ